MYAGHDAQHAHSQEKSDAKPYRDQQDGIIDVRDSLGQHLQIRLCDGNGEAQHKADDQNQRQIAGFGQGGADTVADGGHRSFGAQRKQPHAGNDKECSDQKAQQQVSADRGDGQAKQQYNNHDRQDRNGRLA